MKTIPKLPAGWRVTADGRTARVLDEHGREVISTFLFVPAVGLRPGVVLRALWATLEAFDPHHEGIPQ